MSFRNMQYELPLDFHCKKKFFCTDDRFNLTLQNNLIYSPTATGSLLSQDSIKDYSFYFPLFVSRANVSNSTFILLIQDDPKIYCDKTILLCRPALNPMPTDSTMRSIAQTFLTCKENWTTLFFCVFFPVATAINKKQPKFRYIKCIFSYLHPGHCGGLQQAHGQGQEDMGFVWDSSVILAIKSQSTVKAIVSFTVRDTSW